MAGAAIVVPFMLWLAVKLDRWNDRRRGQPPNKGKGNKPREERV
jgi:hypothetical protein